MDTHYPPLYEPATPEYVLSVLQDMHRQMCQCYEADRDVSLSFESTVADWRDAWDLFDWRRLGRAENQFWGINRSDSEWHAVLEPADERRLADICKFVARHAQRPLIRPLEIAGLTCRPAGAFLTVQSMLLDQGAPVEHIAPSTPLCPFTTRHYHLFLGPISRLAPGAIPNVKFENPIARAGGCLVLLALFCLVIGWCGAAPLSIALAAILLVVGLGLAQSEPETVTFGDLRTFRDLANVLGNGAAEAGRATRTA